MCIRDRARIKGLQLGPEEASSLSVQLKGQGYSARAEGDTMFIKQELAP